MDNLRPNGVYEFRVRAKNAEGLGVPSKSSGATHIKGRRVDNPCILYKNKYKRLKFECL